MNIWNFLWFQGSFNSYNIVKPSSKIEHTCLILNFISHFFYLVRIFKHFLYIFFQSVKWFYIFFIFFPCNFSKLMSHISGKKIKNYHLCSICLRWSNCNFRPCPCINHMISFPCYWWTYNICYSHNSCPVSLCFLHCFKSIQSFSWLT